MACCREAASPFCWIEKRKCTCCGKKSLLLPWPVLYFFCPFHQKKGERPCFSSCISCTNQLTLPLNYHAKVQGLLYKLIQGFPDYSDFLHDTGYSDGGKQFKLFCFSDLTGPHHLRGKTIIFPQRFSFQLRTADPTWGTCCTRR